MTKMKCDKCGHSYMSPWAELDRDMNEVKSGKVWACTMGHKTQKKDSCKDFNKA